MHPCKKMAPILKELSEEYKDRVIIKVIEIDQESGLTTATDSSHPDPNIFDAKNQEVLRHEVLWVKMISRKYSEDGDPIAYGDPSQSSVAIAQWKPFLAYLGVFVGGILSSSSPCVLATIPLVIGYVEDTREEIVERPCSIP